MAKSNIANKLDSYLESNPNEYKAIKSSLRSLITRYDNAVRTAEKNLQYAKASVVHSEQRVEKAKREYEEAVEYLFSIQSNDTSDER